MAEASTAEAEEELSLSSSSSSSELSSDSKEESEEEKVEETEVAMKSELEEDEEEYSTAKDAAKLSETSTQAYEETLEVEACGEGVRWGFKWCSLGVHFMIVDVYDGTAVDKAGLVCKHRFIIFSLSIECLQCARRVRHRHPDAVLFRWMAESAAPKTN